MMPSSIAAPHLASHRCGHCWIGGGLSCLGRGNSGTLLFVPHIAQTSLLTLIAIVAFGVVA